jgi:hypothetical protein
VRRRGELGTATVLDELVAALGARVSSGQRRWPASVLDELAAALGAQVLDELGPAAVADVGLG